MDDTVDEVFRSMLNQPCTVVGEDPPLGTDISARISLSGTLEVLCVVEFPAPSAKILTGAFLGSGEENWDDTMIADAVGELCNMIAGGWKKRLGEAAWAASLSTPSICRGCPHSSECNLNDGRMRARRAYAFGQSSFAVCFTER
jgi:chemotaxis protein CheX